MTKPDSTDAGGVTHEEARDAVIGMARESGWMAVGRKLTRYIDAQEAALATLTRERDSLRERLDAANAICRARLVALEKLRDTGQVPLTCHDCGELTFVGHACQPATPPAPLPGGQRQVEAGHLVYADAALKNSSRATRNGLPDGAFLELRIAVRHIIDHLKEQGGEGREG